jgi:hypothetical protein
VKKGLNIAGTDVADPCVGVRHANSAEGKPVAETSGESGRLSRIDFRKPATGCQCREANGDLRFCNSVSPPACSDPHFRFELTCDEAIGDSWSVLDSSTRLDLPGIDQGREFP